MATPSWFLYAFIPLLLWRIYARIRRNIGRQRSRPWRHWFGVVLFPLLVAMFTLVALSNPLAEAGLWGGLGGGLALGAWALRLTRFERTPEGFFYTPNAYIGVGLSLLTDNLWFDVIGTALIGLLLVAVAIVLGIETKSLLLGESASAEAELRITDALTATEGIDRVIHLKTMHLGPDELLVAAKIAVPAVDSAADVAGAIDAAESSIRRAEPTARLVYLEPDIARTPGGG